METGWADLIGIGGVPATLLLVQIFVRPWVSDSRFYPLAAIAIGAALNILGGLALGSPWQRVALYCLLTGLAAAGSYSTQERVRALAKGTPPDA